jgi:cobalt-zinc-cadmium efflux system membrane fusion protein
VHEVELGPGEVEVSAALAKEIGLETEVLRPTVFNQVIRAAGRFISPLQDEVVISAPSSGLVHFTSNQWTVGTRLNQGQAVGYIQSSSLGDGDAYQKQRLQYQTAQIELERAERLLKDSLISQRNFLDRKLAYETAKVSFDALNGVYSAKGLAIKSPKSAYIKQILVEEGSFVNSGQAIMVLTQQKRVHLQVDLSPRHVQLLPRIKSANVRLDPNEPFVSITQFNGQLVSYHQGLSKNSHYLPVLFELDYTGKIISGGFADVYLQLDTQTDALVVPPSALIEEQGLYYVYVMQKPNLFKKVEVKKVAEDGLQIQIAGLEEGKEIVTKGALQLKLSSMNAAIPHGHSH